MLFPFQSQIRFYTEPKIDKNLNHGVKTYWNILDQNKEYNS